MAISKSEQAAEAIARETERGGNQIEQVPEVEAEITSPPAEAAPPTKQVEPPNVQEPQAKPIVRSKFDIKRDQLIADFKLHRQEEAADDDSDTAQIRKFTREGMPPELMTLETPPTETPTEQLAEEEVVEELAPATQLPPTKHKVVVRGKEMELTDEELKAAAQKSLAADDYLDEAKKKLNEVSELQRAIQSQVARPAQPPVHSGKQNGSQQAETDTTPAEGAEHPGDQDSALGEKVQFGEPSEVGRVIRQEIDTSTGEQVKRALLEERLRNEAVRTQKILNDFQKEHAELAQDRFASAAIRERLVEMQVEDLKALGLDEGTLPKTQDQVAEWHKFYRSEGHNVRDVPTLLKSARDEFLQWKGVPKVETTTPADKPNTPKVDLSQTRQVRRAAIPQSPSRTVAPKQDATQILPQKDRSDIVQQMKNVRSKLRGGVVVT